MERYYVIIYCERRPGLWDWKPFPHKPSYAKALDLYDSIKMGEEVPAKAMVLIVGDERPVLMRIDGQHSKMSTFSDLQTIFSREG